jgi:hypothetical protein
MVSAVFASVSLLTRAKFPELKRHPGKYQAILSLRRCANVVKGDNFWTVFKKIHDVFLKDTPDRVETRKKMVIM